MSTILPRIEWATAMARHRDNLLEDEFQAERASALGHGARRMEAALQSLDQADPAARPLALAEARRRAWEFMVQREAAGLRDWPAVIRLYRIPNEVLRGMGAMRPDQPDHKAHRDSTD
ncbi:hypothetical protein FNJ84_11295 [Paracoccus sp. M683]|uniref:DUF6665 family protein n=1 Tax=Paracoccus sp. M683 TaxID=2594268 RepID=UPI00117C1B50|nr:DUF6665 family protein [Paracoccus sp. M683]TRW96659.1 hypothetical protein FNJ84_11295 [Paracoccus sp. M683]